LAGVSVDFSAVPLLQFPFLFYSQLGRLGRVDNRNELNIPPLPVGAAVVPSADGIFCLTPAAGLVFHDAFDDNDATSVPIVVDRFLAASTAAATFCS
jgi:hypothetical protein